MKLFRWLISSLSAVTALAHGAALLAQEKEVAAGSGDKAGWAFSYILVMLLVALGLMAVCRPGTRTSELKRIDTEE